MDTYIHKIGLKQYSQSLDSTILNSIVQAAFLQKYAITQKELLELYLYDVPKLGPNGTCSITHEKEDQPYNLAHLFFGPSTEITSLIDSPMTLQLRRLHQVVSRLQHLTKVDWL